MTTPMFVCVLCPVDEDAWYSKELTAFVEHLQAQHSLVFYWCSTGSATDSYPPRCSKGGTRQQYFERALAEETYNWGADAHYYGEQ